MNLRFTLTLVVLTAIGLTAGTVAARDAAEVELVRRAIADTEAASAVTRSSETLPTERAGALLDRWVDVAAFESRVFADVAPSLTPAQKKTLSEAFRPLLVHRIAIRLRDVPLAKPAIDPPREDGGETHVRLVYKAEAGGEDLEVDLSFGKRAGVTTPLRVADATIGGTSLSKNLRASVNKVMRRDGFDALVARLKQLREANGSGPHRSSDLAL